MKTQKLAELGLEELRIEEEKLAEQIFRFRFQLQTGNVENPSRLKFTRRELARVKTLARERELGIERVRKGPTGEERPVETVAAGAATAAGAKSAKRPRRSKSREGA